jgi:hypothetical protein
MEPIVTKQPLSLQLGYGHYAEDPSDSPDWGLRFAVMFLFPKYKSLSTPK